MSDVNGDSFTYQDSISSTQPQPTYTSKQWAYQTDLSNGSYGTKQIIFDLSGFYNSQRFINPQEMVMVFPVVTTMTSAPHVGPSGAVLAASGLGAGPRITQLFDDNGGAVTNQYAMGYKSGYWHLINSIQIQVDGKDVIQLTPNINFHASFVANTTWSKSDVTKHGPLTGYLPDTADTFVINASGAYSAQGYGVCNNGLPPQGKQPVYPGFLATQQANGGASPARLQPSFAAAAPTQSTDLTVNEGYWQRMRSTNRFNPYVSQVGNAAYTQQAVNTRLSSAQGKVYEPQATINQCLDNQMVSETMALDTTASGTVDNANIDCKYTTSFRQLLTTCVVRFKDVCDLFGKLPLTRGLYMRVTLNMNTGYLKVGASAPLAPLGGSVTTLVTTAGAYPTYSTITQNTFPGTCPLMLSPLVVSAPIPQNGTATSQYPLAAFTGRFIPNSCLQLYPGVACDAGSYNRDGLIVSVSLVNPDPIHQQLGFSGVGAGNTLQSHSLTNCRIYAPIVDMEPQLVSKYITQHKEQGVYYRDVLQFSLTGVKTLGQFTYQLANGIVNAKRLVIIPFYHDDTNTGSAAPTLPFVATANDTTLYGSTEETVQQLYGGPAGVCTSAAASGFVFGAPNMTALPYEPISPFDSAPATCAPGNSLINFNVLVSNMNVFQRNISYSFENFIEEMSPANALNGGLDTGLTSGLIDSDMWSQGYRYYVVDLSRRLAGDNTPKSLTLIGQNGSAYMVDYYCFVEYERHLTLDIESGHILVSSN